MSSEELFETTVRYVREWLRRGTFSRRTIGPKNSSIRETAESAVFKAAKVVNEKFIETGEYNSSCFLLTAEERMKKDLLSVGRKAYASSSNSGISDRTELTDLAEKAIWEKTKDIVHKEEYSSISSKNINTLVKESVVDLFREIDSSWSFENAYDSAGHYLPCVGDAKDMAKSIFIDCFKAGQTDSVSILNAVKEGTRKSVINSIEFNRITYSIETDMIVNKAFSKSFREIYVQSVINPIKNGYFINYKNSSSIEDEIRRSVLKFIKSGVFDPAGNFIITDFKISNTTTDNKFYSMIEDQFGLEFFKQIQEVFEYYPTIVVCLFAFAAPLLVFVVFYYFYKKKTINKNADKT